MKRKLLLFLSLFFPIALMANPVGKEEAKAKALSFLNAHSPAKARGIGKNKALELAVSHEFYHAFNIGQDEGFIIVSGDDCAIDILGYADDGRFDQNNMPENMRHWLDGYADEIKWAKEHNIRSTPPHKNKSC